MKNAGFEAIFVVVFRLNKPIVEYSLPDANKFSIFLEIPSHFINLITL